jgi:replicative DNA helicase
MAMTQVPNPADGSQPRGSDASGEFQRLPPHSIEAEACVLGSMVLHAPCVDSVVQIVREEHFYRPAHQMLFRVLVELKDAAKPIDLVSVREELSRRNQLETIGGIEYVVALVEGVPSAANAEYYAQVVRDKGLLRELILAGTDIVNEAYQTQDEATEFLDHAEERIFQVASKHVVSESASLSEVLTQTFEQLQEQEGQLVTGLPSGYHQLDELTSGFQDNEMLILAARPSMGKTSLLLNIAEHIAVVDKTPVAIFSLEMSQQQLTQRLLASYARFDLKQMRRGMIRPEDWTKLKLAAGDLEPAPLYVDDSPLLTIMQLRAKARRLYARHEIRCILIDYLQLMSYTGRANSRQEQISEISRGIKALARELAIPIVAAAQLNRGPADRPSHRPRMSDLRESGSIEQDADVIMLLHNEDYYHKGEEGYIPKNSTELIIEKQRNGPTGVVNFQFLPAITRFEAAAPGYVAAEGGSY